MRASCHLSACRLEQDENGIAGKLESVTAVLFDDGEDLTATHHAVGTALWLRGLPPTHIHSSACVSLCATRAQRMNGMHRMRHLNAIILNTCRLVRLACTMHMHAADGGWHERAKARATCELKNPFRELESISTPASPNPPKRSAIAL